MRLIQLLEALADDKTIAYWTKYAGHRGFPSEEEARSFIARKAGLGSAWTMGIDDPKAHYAQLAQEMPVYQLDDGWHIGTPEAMQAIERQREEAARFAWNKVDYLDVDWTSIFSLGLLNQFDIDHIDGPDLVPMDEITPVEDHDADHVARIAAEMQEGLEFRPIVLTADGAIVDGHHRYEAAKLLGMKDIPAYVAYTHDDMDMAEGMDNAFFFSKDQDTESPKYPLPTNATSYRSR